MRVLLLVIIFLGVGAAFPTVDSHHVIFNDGKPAEPGQFPFLVSINLTLLNVRFCSGSIINENWVLSTAICTVIGEEISDWVVVISRPANGFENGDITYNVSQVVVHPKFNISNIQGNDIALFKIDGSFVFSDLIQPIQLGQVSANDTVVATGWGSIEADDTPTLLQYTDLSVWSNEDCMKHLEEIIESGEVCAFAGQGMGFCVRDIAAPLVHNGTLVGLQSWSPTIKSCRNEPLSVYTRVSVFQDWINGIIRESWIHN